MKIVGIKPTHDASIAVIEDGVITHCHELEKMGRERYAAFSDFRSAIDAAGKIVDLDRIDGISIDGWKNGGLFAAYHEFELRPPQNTGYRKLVHLPVPARGFECVSSFHHVYGHVAGSYMMSPYAGEDAYILVWDGGTQPRLYLWEAGVGATFVDTLHEIYGLVYGIKGYYWGPFKDASKQVRNGIPPSPDLKFYGGYSMPGKLMGWIGLGTVRDCFPLIDQIYDEALALCGRKRHLGYNQDGALEHLLCAGVRDALWEMKDEDAMATFHAWLTDFTIRQLRLRLPAEFTLINTGGCALNIKLNSALRKEFGQVWVPPVPNDSGSGIGAAASEWFHLTGKEKLEWNVYSGPTIFQPGESRSGWMKKPGGLREVAAKLAAGKVVCFLDGKAEIGPRALGNRSLLADPRTIESKDRLNAFKGREDWRPVSPIALPEDCFEHFGVKEMEHLDPYMIFDHHMPEKSRALLPAVAHVDGTARLQTCLPGTAACYLLREFKKLTGFGVLCNTSANEKGKGFFHHLWEAQLWCEREGVEDLWVDGILYKAPQS